MMGGAWRAARAMASLRVTLAGLIAAAVVALIGQDGTWPIGVYIALPFAVLFVNLVAAVATNPALRAQGGLLGFHLALAGLALLVAADRLTAFYGHVEVTEGTAFDPTLVEANAGPFHRPGLDRIRFTQGGFEIHYAPGMKRRKTFSTVYLADGASRAVTVGDDSPLVAGGYRFYTTFNKGFAPVVTFIAADGTAHSGSIHLPSYPLNYYKQGNEWEIPGTGVRMKLWLHIPSPVYAEDRAWRFRKPEDATLVLVDGQRRHELRPGDVIEVGGGMLRYEELRSWMGYTISYNPLISWILAAAAVAAFCLLWHSIARFRRSAWDRGERKGLADAR
jgi:cytochrome c biogenesis protein